MDSTATALFIRPLTAGWLTPGCSAPSLIVWCGPSIAPGGEGPLRRDLTIEVTRAVVESAPGQGCSMLAGHSIEAAVALPADFIPFGSVAAFRRAESTEAARNSPIRSTFCCEMGS
jgi:hypothetical protein